MVLISVSLYSLFLTDVLFEFVFNKNAFKTLVEHGGVCGKSLWGRVTSKQPGRLIKYFQTVKISQKKLLSQEALMEAG